MILPSTTYPSKRVPDTGGDFPVRQYYIPIQIGDAAVWGILDPGAKVSILPKEVARRIPGIELSDEADGGYNLARLISVPYKTKELNLGIFDYIGGTIKTLDSDTYMGRGDVAFTVEQVEFQIPIQTWEEMGENIQVEEPLLLRATPMNSVILGSKGLLEDLHFTFYGNEAVVISEHNPIY